MENYGGDVTALTNDIRSALIESLGNLASDVHYMQLLHVATSMPSCECHVNVTLGVYWYV